MNEDVERIRQSVNWGGRVKRLNLLVVMALVLSLVMPLAAPLAQATARVQPLLLEMAVQQPDQMVSVIVQKTVKDDRVEQAVGALGGTITKDLHIINAFAAEMKAKDVAQLAKIDGVKWVSLDGRVTSASLINYTVRDEFAAVSYSNNNGTQSWTGNWIETGEEGSASSGSMKITSAQLQLANKTRTLYRAANLTQAVTATLSFQYKRSGLDDANDYVALQISANGGTTWTELARYAGPGTDSALAAASFNITGYRAANTTIRFATSRRWALPTCCTSTTCRSHTRLTMAYPPAPMRATSLRPIPTPATTARSPGNPTGLKMTPGFPARIPPMVTCR